MDSNIYDFGDLVLLIGDFHIPNRVSKMPPCFQEMLNTNKIQHILCTGNIGDSEVVDQLRLISNSLHIVKGDMDTKFDYPEQLVLTIGDFKIGLLHGHQILPWGETNPLLEWQRRLDCDILVFGNTHQTSISEISGKYFLNPGSVTGAFHPSTPNVSPSFMLMAIRGPAISVYLYKEKDGTVNVDMFEMKKSDGISDTN